MKSSKNRHFYIFLSIIILFGLVLRFTHIDRKVYWLDEAWTSLRISGYSEVNMMTEIQDYYLEKNSIIKSNNLLKYQSVNSDKDITDVLDSIQQNDPTHTPLYFILARFWNILKGDSSVSTTRYFSAVCGVLFVIFFFILSRQLFENSLAAWIGTSIASISPFFILYAQEARPYSLFSVTVLLSCITLFKALKHNHTLSWTGYILFTLSCLYTSWLSVLLQLSQFCIVIIHEDFKFSRRLIRFIFCSAVVFACILPWSLHVNWQEFYRQGSLGNSSTMSFVDKIGFLIQSTGQNCTRLLIDLKFYGLFNYGFLTLIATLLIIYSFIFIFIEKRFKLGLYVIILTLPTPLVFALRDILSRSGVRSDLNRYFIISYIGILLALTYFFSQKIRFLLKNTVLKDSLSLQRSIHNSKIYLMFFLLIISLEALSSLQIINSITWYNKVSADIPEVSEIIDQSSNPLIIMHPLHVERLAIFSLINYIQKPIDFILINETAEAAYIPTGYDAYFLFSPPFYGAPSYTIPELFKHFQVDLQELIVYEGIPLFKFETADP